MKKNSALAIIAIIFGASGMGFGMYGVFFVMPGEVGPQGDSGNDGIDGIDGINGTDYTPEEFTLPNVPLVPFSPDVNTVMLLHMEGDYESEVGWTPNKPPEYWRFESTNPLVGSYSHQNGIQGQSIPTYTIIQKAIPEGTIEFYFKLHEFEGGSAFVQLGNSDNLSIFFTTDGRVRLSEATLYIPSLYTEIRIVPFYTYHLAVTWNTTGRAIWLNGTKAAWDNVPLSYYDVVNPKLDVYGPNAPVMLMDEFRFSNVTRYNSEVA